MYYILEGKNVIPTDSTTWSNWFNKAKRHVDFTELDGLEVSTVFLGLDHNHFGGAPHIFETMIFDADGNDKYCTRCTTWLQAEEMHKKAIEWIKKGCIDDSD